MKPEILNRRNNELIPSIGTISPFSSLMNSLLADDILNRNMLPNFRDAFDTDIGVRAKEVENGTEYQFALPGVAREHINIDIDGDYLLVQAEEKISGESRFARYRALLSPEANKKTLKAKYIDGLLTISVEDRKEEKKPVAVEWMDKSGKEAIEGQITQNEVEQGKPQKKDKVT